MAQIEFEKELRVQKTAIEGLLIAELPVHGDSRGWFKENWQRAKMTAQGVPDIRMVQNNVSFNAQRGVTRGVHAEPWDKWISVATGRIFGAWVDLREGSSTYGKVVTAEVDASRAVFTPRGVGNSFQALEDGTAYTYLVNAHWSAELKKTYTFVNLADPELAIEWPIPLGQATVSDADKNHPMLADVVPMAPKRTLVTGWAANATGPALLARACAEHGVTLVHISSDYVFDGTRELHVEDEPLSPISVYGQSKAAGDLAVAGLPAHYILRSSWVIGEGKNFAKTMCMLSDKVAAGDLAQVTVVDDQLGRLTFTDQMAAAIFHVLDTKAPYGTYDMTGSGAVKSWADIAKACFDAANGNGEKVVPVSTAEYYASAEGPIAPRPHYSALDLGKLEATGFTPRDWEEELAEYLKVLLEAH